MTLSRTVRQCLAIAVSFALLRPEVALAAAVETARMTPLSVAAPVVPGAAFGVSAIGAINLALPQVTINAGALSMSGAPALAGQAQAAAAAAPTAAALPGAAAPEAAASVARHPVIETLNQLQVRGVVLPETTVTRADAAKLMDAAAALPEGRMRDQLTSMAKAASVSMNSAGVDGSGLNAAFDGSNASAAPAADNIWTKMSKWSWVPNGLAKRFAAKGEKNRPAPAITPASSLEVPIEKLRWTPAPDMLPESTREIAVGDKQIVGQDRALKSIYFGLKMPGANYNLFVSGPDGSGRETALRHIVGQLARTMPTPNDVVAVTNFDNPNDPLILQLPAGTAARFQAAVDGFVEAYEKVLPQVLSSKDVVAAKKAIKAEWEAGVQERQDAFDADVAKVVVNGKFGIKIVTQQTENGMSVGVVPTYKDQNGEMVSVTSEEELKGLVESGAFTMAEWQQALKDGRAAAQPFLERLEAEMHQNQAEAEEANGKIAQINRQVAAQVAQQLAPKVVGAVSKNRHDTPAHKEFEKKMAEREAAFEAEVAKVRLGQYGIMVAVEGGQLVIGLTKDEGGKMVPMTAEEAQAKIQSGEVTQAAIQKAVKPLIAKLQAINELNQKEHEAVHAKDTPPTAEEKAAITWVKRMLGVAASNFGVFVQGDEEPAPGKRKIDPSEMFRVSVLSNNLGVQGAPVVWEMSPSYERLFGSAEDNTKVMLVPGVGAVKTEGPGGPTLKAGSFLKANGGFLIMNVMDVLREPGSWQALMQAVRNGQAEIAEGGIMGMMTQKGDKYHVPAKVKVVLLGSPTLKMLLAQHDEDFARSFNAAAEFEPTLSIGKEAVDGYLQFMAKVIAQSGGAIMHMTRDGIAAIMEYAARVVDSNQKMTAQFGAMYSLMKEASFWAKEAGRNEVRREDIDAALAARSDAQDVYSRHMMDVYKAGVFKVQTQGAEVGQINGLAVMGSFGVPMQIQATYSANGGGFRITSSDAAAGTVGSSWKKSFADVEAYLNNLLGQKRPLTGTLNISFVQNYGGIDGDSATSTMIYAALSALSGVPIQQRFANTGSASPKKGTVQAIGGANEKTEGFFTVASGMVNKAYADGLNSVIIPYDNMNDLMLNPAVVQAVREGRFKIYRATTIKEGMELLTGVPFETVIKKAEARLNELRAAARP
jgi:predicted ATP-dependent protease